MTEIKCQAKRYFSLTIAILTKRNYVFEAYADS